MRLRQRDKSFNNRDGIAMPGERSRPVKALRKAE